MAWLEPGTQSVIVCEKTSRYDDIQNAILRSSNKLFLYQQTQFLRSSPFFIDF